MFLFKIAVGRDIEFVGVVAWVHEIVWTEEIFSTGSCLIWSKVGEFYFNVCTTSGGERIFIVSAI